jgi:Txe/YoeB family toxin of Txe-Axe toxin-antitoxin module
MKLSSEIRFADEKIKEAFYKLENGDEQEKELFKLLDQAINNIEENAFCGIQLPKRLIPPIYHQRGIKNLWKYDLPRGWRLVYSIVNEELVVISIVLEWFDHKEYEKRFKY